MSETTFTVTDDQLATQLVNGSMISDSHYVWVDPDMAILTEDGPRPALQTMWYLETGHWTDRLHVLCGEARCLLPEHVTDSQAKADEAAQAAKDAADLALVQRTAVNLADLYRRGKARGLLTQSGGYGTN